MNNPKLWIVLGLIMIVVFNLSVIVSAYQEKWGWVVINLFAIFLAGIIVGRNYRVLKESKSGVK